MRLREREMPLDPQVERELEAIDRAVAGEPVDPDLELLAELARALSEERVDTEPGFAAELDQRVADGFPRPGHFRSHRLAELRKRLTAVPPRRILARAGAAATLLVVVGVTISQSGEIWGGGGGTFNTQPAPDRRVGAALAAAEEPAAGRRPRVTLWRSTSARPRGRWGPPSAQRCGSSVSGISSSEATPPMSPSPSARSPAASTWPCRLRRSASGPRPTASWTWSAITAATFCARTSPGRSRRATVADRPRQLRASDSGRTALRRAGRPFRPRPCGFADRRPSGHHEPVRVGPEANRRSGGDAPEAAAPARRGGDGTEQESIKRRLAIVEAQLSAAEDDLGAAQQRVQKVPVSVSIDADRALAGGDDAGGWGLGNAVDDAGKVLSVTAGVLLISVAVLGPLAILAALIWLGTRGLARLRRERALDQI